MRIEFLFNDTVIFYVKANQFFKFVIEKFFFEKALLMQSLILETCLFNLQPPRDLKSFRNSTYSWLKYYTEIVQD